MMEKIKKESIATCVSIIVFNVLLLSTCSFLGCYNITFENIFRLNLLCNACTDMSYQLQKYQIQIYVFIGGYFVSKLNELITKAKNF